MSSPKKTKTKLKKVVVPEVMVKEVLAKIITAQITISGVMKLQLIVTMTTDGKNYDICNCTLDDFTADQAKRVGTVFGCEMIRRMCEVFGSLKNAEGRYIHVLVQGERAVGFKTLKTDGPESGMVWDSIKKEFLG